MFNCNSNNHSIPTIIQLSEKCILDDCPIFSFFYFDCNSFALYDESSKHLLIRISKVKKNLIPDDLVYQVEQITLFPRTISIEEEPFFGFSSL